MRNFIEWLEIDSKRTRKFLAVSTFVVWVVTLITAIVFKYFDKELFAILSLVTGQLTAVMGFYMITKASSDV